MTIVLDATAALAAVLHHPAKGSILGALESASVVIAPDLFATEVASGLRRYASARQLEPDAAARLLESALGLVDRYVPVASLAREALHESVSLGVPVPDLCYVILARREGATVLTIDRKLERLLAEMRVGSVLRAKKLTRA